MSQLEEIAGKSDAQKRQAEIAKQKAEEEQKKLSYRYTDNGDGTVTDNRTGLIWLKKANCFGRQNWNTAMESATKLADGQCGLTDDSIAGDWRLPNTAEWQDMVDEKYTMPALSNAAGTDQWKEGDAFLNVQGDYWSSNTGGATIIDGAWYMILSQGFLYDDYQTAMYYVWPVRGGH